MLKRKSLKYRKKETKYDEVYENHDFRGFKIMYRQAIKYGETVKCCYGESESAYTITVKGAEGDLRAIIELCK